MLTNKMKKTKESGMTLIETLIVITFGLAIVAFALTLYGSVRDKNNVINETENISLIYNQTMVDDKEYAKCAVIDTGLERLECFDNLAKKKNLDGRQVQPTSIEDKGKWRVSVGVNPIDDSKTVTLFLDADSGKNRWGDTVSLVARCKNNSTELYINWKSFLVSEADVITRIGDNKAVTQRWSMSTNNSGSFHPEPIPFLKEMLTSPKLLAQVTPYSESPVTAIFNTAGLENAIKPLRETCSW